MTPPPLPAPPPAPQWEDRLADPDKFSNDLDAYLDWLDSFPVEQLRVN